MLPDKKIDSLGAHLEQFKLHDRGRQIDLENLLTEYHQLLNEYKVLKRAYEEKITNAIAKPVAIATSVVAAAKRPLDSYVLVLVDGNDYIFNDELIRDKEEGGMRAARKLNDAIEKYVHQNVPQTLSRRVIVRIYADLTNLSKQLGRLKLTGLEKRSIASFTAGFTRAIGLFDFIDTLDEEGTKFKIREQFKIASEDAGCSHILFAACNDPAYLSLLVSYNGPRDKITLVQGSRWHSEFHQFNLEVTEFPTIFSWSGLPSAPPVNTVKSVTPTPPKQKAPVQQPVQKAGLAAIRKESWRRNDSVSVVESVLTAGPQTSREDSWRRNGPVSATESAFGESSPEESNDFVDQEPEPTRWDSPPPRDRAPQSVRSGPTKHKALCRHFQKGFCRSGRKCNFEHGPNSLTGSVNGGDGSQDCKPLLSPTVQSFSGSSTQAPAESSQSYRASMVDRTEISAYLPKESVPGFIPLNKLMQRLDTYGPPPSGQDWKVYNERFQKAKPCNSYHLEGSCTAYDCKFDHNPLSEQEKGVLAFVVKRSPCPRRGACRRRVCIYGHLCQKEDCRGPKGYGTKKCWFKPELHYGPEECELASLVPAEDDDEGEVGGGRGGGRGGGGRGRGRGGGYEEEEEEEEEERRGEGGGRQEESIGTAMENGVNGLTADNLAVMEQVDLMW